MPFKEEEEDETLLHIEAKQTRANVVNITKVELKKFFFFFPSYPIISKSSILFH